MSGISRTYNLKYASTVDFLADALIPNSAYQDLVRIRYVLVEWNKQWYVPILVANIFTRDQQKPPPKDELDYRSVRLCEDWVPMHALVDALRKDCLQLSKLSFIIKTNQGAERTFHSSNNSFHRNPGHLYLLGWQDHVSFVNQDVLLGHKLPYYPDLTAAIRGWTELADYSESHSYSGKLLLFVPECRAYINKLDRSGEILRLGISRLSSDITDLRIKGAYWPRLPDTQYERIDVDVPAANSVELPISKDSSRLELFLIGPNDTLYDYHREGRWPTEGIASVLAADRALSSNEKIVEQAIRSGEGVNVEFKPYLDVTHKKTDELIRTVIAFANTQGGNVLIGVDDDCQVIGIEQELVKRYRDTTRDLAECASRYLGEVLQLIKSRVVPTVDVELATVFVADHRVLLVKVAAGDDRPYREARNEHFYVRRGASNVHPNNEELRGLVPPSPKATRSWGNA